MTDFMTVAQRSRAMSRVRSRDTEAELRLRSHLHGIGFRFRTNVRRLPGSPDIVLTRYKAAIFVHGCFWHGHPGCTKDRLPSTNTEFWQKKIAATKRRDEAKLAALQAAGWRSAVVWECVVNALEKSEQTAQQLAHWLRGDSPTAEIGR